jgi:hypothetical protein
MPAAERQPSAAAIQAIHRTMSGLGFSTSAIAVYLRLLIHGRRTSRQLRDAAEITDAQMFEATRELKRVGLVTEYRHGDRTTWYCTDPAVAWLSLAADITWTAMHTMAPVDRLPKTGVPEVDHRSALFRAAVRPAIRLWTGENPPRRESRTARNANTLAQLAVEAVMLARVRIRAISASPKVSSAARFWPALVAQMKAGVTYVRLTDLMEVYEHGLELVKRDLSQGVDLRIGLTEELTAIRGYVADRRVLVRYEPAPSDEQPHSGYMTSDKHAIDRFVRRFDRYAAAAVKAEVAIRHLEGIVPELTSAAITMSADAREWLDELIRVGKYSTLPTVCRWTQAHKTDVEAELLREGVAVRSRSGLLLPNWPDPSETTHVLLRPV